MLCVASAAPWHAPTDQPMEPQRFWFNVVTRRGNSVFQMPEFAGPVSVTMMSFSRRKLLMRGQEPRLRDDVAVVVTLG